MAKIWETLPDGTLKLTVSPDEGGPASVFYGQSRDEILDKVIDSQANANRRIDQLRVSGGKPNGHAAPPPPTVQPKPMTANERMQAVADLSNPATVDQGVTRIMESVIGPVDEFNRDRDAQRQQRLEQAAVTAAEEFTALTPGFFLSDFNCATLVNYIRNMGYPPDQVSSYQRGFNELSAAQLLQTKSAQPHSSDVPPDEPQERNAPTLTVPRAPARYSTGVRQSDISGTAPVPVKRLKWTREQIASMGPGEMRRLINDPEFNLAVEYYSRTPKKKALPV